MQSPLEALREYYAAFSTLDLPTITSYFNEPCLSIGSHGVFAVPSRGGLAAAIAPMVAELQAKGYGRSEFIDPDVTPLTEDDVLIRGVAVRYTTAGPELERVRLSYLLHRSDAGWKIAVLVMPA